MAVSSLGGKLVVIVGETASGKSALALELAKRFDGELICADSWTVYKDFNIGTAKPSAEERAEVPHHLLDVADPAVGFSAVEFQKLAFAAIDDVTSRGKLPILVGGTGLYIDAVLYNYQFLPAPPEGLRDELSALTLMQVQQRAMDDGLDTTGIDMRNKRRVIRLIENAGVRPTKHELRNNTLIIGIQRDREHLRQRIEQRTDVMLTMGLEHEVRTLAGKYGWQAEPMKGIGYREFEAFMAPNSQNNQGVDDNTNEVDLDQKNDGRQSLEQTRERIIAATMGLAKRQRTWFKRNLSIQWVDGDAGEHNSVQTAADMVKKFLNQ